MRLLPRPRRSQRGTGIRSAVASLGRFARPFVEGAVRSILPSGFQRLKKAGISRLKSVGSKAIKAGSEMLKEAAVSKLKGGALVSGFGSGDTNYYPFISKGRSTGDAISPSHSLAKRKTRKRKKTTNVLKGGKKKKKKIPLLELGR